MFKVNIILEMVRSQEAHQHKLQLHKLQLQQVQNYLFNQNKPLQIVGAFKNQSNYENKN